MRAQNSQIYPIYLTELWGSVNEVMHHKLVLIIQKRLTTFWPPYSRA